MKKETFRKLDKKSYKFKGKTSLASNIFIAIAQ